MEKKVSPDSMPSSDSPVKAVSVVCRVCLDSLVHLVRMDCWVLLELRDRVVSPEFPEYPEFLVNPALMANLVNLARWVYRVYLVLILKRVNRVFLDCPEDMDSPEEPARKERRVTTVRMDLLAFRVCLAYRSRAKRVNLDLEDFLVSPDEMANQDCPVETDYPAATDSKAKEVTSVRPESRGKVRQVNLDSTVCRVYPALKACKVSTALTESLDPSVQRDHPVWMAIPDYLDSLESLVLRV